MSEQLIDPNNFTVTPIDGDWVIFDVNEKEWFVFPRHMAGYHEQAMELATTIVNAINYGHRVGYEAGYKQAQRDIAGAIGVVLP